MEVKHLPAVILMFVMVGMLIGVGILTFSKFGSSISDEITITLESITWPSINDNVTFAKGNLTSFTQVLNSSGDAVDTSNYTVSLSEGRLQVLGNTSGCADGDTCTVDYKYTEYDTILAYSMNSMGDAVGAIPSIWLPLIITVLALAVIMFLVIRGFGMGRR